MSTTIEKLKKKRVYFITLASLTFVFLLTGIILTAVCDPFAFLDVKDIGVAKYPNRQQLIWTIVSYLLAAFFVGLIVVEIRNDGKKMSIVNKRRTFTEKALLVLIFLFFAVFSLIFVYLLAWGFLSSLKEKDEFFARPAAMPLFWLFENYATAFKTLESQSEVNVIGMTFNSLYFAVTSSALTIFFHCCTGYVFAKYRFRGKNLAFSIVIFTMIIPVFGTLAPLYKLIYQLGITDSYLYVVICCSGFGGQFLVTYAFFKGLDWSYAEAAMMDGAGHMRTFLTIMLPLATPIIIAYFILGCISSWNDYKTAMLFLETKTTLATGLYEFRTKTERRGGDYPLYFAGVFMSMVPTLILFVLFADKVMNSLAIGGLKG